MVGKVHLVLHTVLCITLNIVLKHTSHNAAHGCHKYSKCYECCLKYSKCYDCHHKYSSEVESAEKCHEGFGASQQRSQLLFRTWNNFFNCHVGTNPCAILQIFKPVLKSGVDASLKKTALGKPAMVVPNPLNIYILDHCILDYFHDDPYDHIADAFDDDADDHWHEGEAWCPYNWPSRTPGRPASTWSLSSSPALSSS